MESVRFSPGTLSTMDAPDKEIPFGPRISDAVSTRNTSWRMETSVPRSSCVPTSNEKDLPMSWSWPRSARKPPLTTIFDGFVIDGLTKTLSAVIRRAPQRMLAPCKRATESVVDMPDHVARSGGSVVAGGTTTGMKPAPSPDCGSSRRFPDAWS